jgi:hypothetical protein
MATLGWEGHEGITPAACRLELGLLGLNLQVGEGEGEQTREGM